MADLHSKLTIKNYKIHEQIGEGGFSKVYRASTLENKTVALKLIDDKKSALNEKKCLDKLNKVRGVANLIDYVEYNNKSALVLPILEKNVKEALFMNSQKRNIRNAVSLTIKGLKILKRVHQRGIIHCDIKPGQFMTNKKKIFLIDFGLGRVFWTRNHHEKQKDINKISGTATYASLNCHNGVSLSRRDDLVSFCYTLIDLALGSLP